MPRRSRGPWRCCARLLANHLCRPVEVETRENKDDEVGVFFPALLISYELRSISSSFVCQHKKFQIQRRTRCLSKLIRSTREASGGFGCRSTQYRQTKLPRWICNRSLNGKEEDDVDHLQLTDIWRWDVGGDSLGQGSNEVCFRELRIASSGKAWV